MPRERQIDFPPLQKHHALVTPVCIGVSVLFAVIVIILLAADVRGHFIGPWG